MAEAPACPVCRAPGDVAWLLRKNGWELFRCAACDHIFVDPQPTSEELVRLYSLGDGYRLPEIRFDGWSKFDRKFVRTLGHLTDHVKSGSLLDVGCATGEFMYAARRQGFEVQGVELNPDFAAIASQNGLAVFVGTLEAAPFAQRSFRVIHLGDLIEHVPDPQALLGHVRRLLEPEGRLFVITPVHDAFFPRATYRLFRGLGIPWSHPTPPLHLNQFSTRSLIALLGRVGFAVEELRFAPCSLSYELRQTGAFTIAKRLVRERLLAAAALQAARCAGITALYGAVWLADRCLPFKRTDFALTAVARLRPSR